MKKLLPFILSVVLLTTGIPIAVNASTTKVINKHGSKTYIGTYSDWNSDWDSDNFDVVSNKDIDYAGPLLIKGGTVGDVKCDSSVTMTGGNITSLKSDSNISISGGSIKGNVETDRTVTMSGNAKISGNVTSDNISVSAESSSGNIVVSGNVLFSGTMTLRGTKYKFNRGINGQGSGILQLQSYSGTLPDMTDVNEIVICSGSTVTTDSAISTSNLTLKDGSKLYAKSTLNIDTLAGPGTLIFKAGKLTVNDDITGDPVFDFNGTAKKGTVVFKSKSGRVSTDDVIICGYDLEKDSSSSGYDNFSIGSTSGKGISLSCSSVNLTSGKSITIKALSNPSLSKLDDGTKIYWKLIDPSGNLSISTSLNGSTCKVYCSSAASSSKATLAAYLVDSSGDILSEYKSAICTILLNSSSDSITSGLTLDTTTVNIPLGCLYYILATGSVAAPTQSSNDTAVATVGKAAKNTGNRGGWLYPVAAVGKGTATINIGGCLVTVSVTHGSIIVDTSSYTMAPGNSYTIGVKMNGTDKNKINIHSLNKCTTVQYKGKGSNGVELYCIKANCTGTGYVLFDTPAKGSVRTQINIAVGNVAHGNSKRLIAVA